MATLARPISVSNSSFFLVVQPSSGYLLLTYQVHRHISHALSYLPAQTTSPQYSSYPFVARTLRQGTFQEIWFASIFSTNFSSGGPARNVPPH